MRYAKVYEKDPDATLDYREDWTDWLAADTDTITASQWIVTDGITVETDTHTTTTATIWLSGGETGSNYEITNRITTAGGRVDDRTSLVVVRDR